MKVVEGCMKEEWVAMEIQGYKKVTEEYTEVELVELDIQGYMKVIAG